ncbi:MAG: metallophosphoesterase [Christensenellaceae bacterium]|jgi:predicted MPP superfamily phosphohydrolase|nr:metallophosphoesterase [Christensenellaceae bacterium]
MRKVFKFFSVIITCGSAFITLSSCQSLNANITNALLKFDSSNEFVILQIADTHEWMGVENGVFSVKRMNTLKPYLTLYMDSVIEQVKPDLVVLTGDNIFSLSAVSDLFPDTAISVATYKAFAEYFKKKKQFWSMTFGNHDAESVQTKQTLLSAISNHEYFIGGRHSNEYYKALEILRYDDNGYNDDRLANFSIPIFNSLNEIAFNIFLLDSGSYSGAPAPQNAPYRYILDEQTAWYTSEVERLIAETNKQIPSLIFTHIPLPEFNEIYLAADRKIGILNGLSPSTTSSSIYNVLEKNGTIAFFTGHNHDTSITFMSSDDKYPHVIFGVTPHADGISYYENSSPLMRSRIIKFNTNGDILTYIHTNSQSYYNPNNIENSEILATGSFDNEELKLAMLA